MRKAEVDGQVGYYDEETEDFYPEGTLKKAEVAGKTGLYNPETEDFFPMDFAVQPAPEPKPTRWQDTFTSAIKGAASQPEGTFAPTTEEINEDALSAEEGGRNLVGAAKSAGSAIKNLPLSIAKGIGEKAEMFGDIAGAMRINPQMPEVDVTEETDRATGGLPTGDNAIASLGREAANVHGAILEAETPEFKNQLDKHVYGAFMSAGNTLSTLPANLVVPGSSLLLMGAGSGASEYHDLAKAGVAKPKAAIGGAVNAGIEIATEKLPLDYLTKSFGAPFKKYVVGMMVREVPTELAATAGQLAENAWATSSTLGEATEKYKNAIGPALIDTAIQTPLSAGLQAGAVAAATRLAARPIPPPTPRNLDEYIAQKSQPRPVTPAPVAATVPGQTNTQPVAGEGLESPAGEPIQNEPIVPRRTLEKPLTGIENPDIVPRKQGVENGISNMQLRKNSSAWSEAMPGLSREIYERMAQQSPDDLTSAEKNELSQLRTHISETGEDTQTAMQSLWGSKLADAPPRLRQAIVDSLAMPSMSFGASQGAIAQNEPAAPLRRGTDIDLDQFKESLRKSGVDPDAPQFKPVIDQYLAHLKPRSTDAMTGFQSRVEWERAMPAIGERAAAGENVSYTEIDLPGTKAGNAELGRPGVDRHLAQKFSILEGTIKKYIPDAQFFRHGGDEAQVVSTAPKEVQEKALEEARLRLSQYDRANGLDKYYSHGVGLYHATETMGEFDSWEDAVEEANQKIERNKVLAKGAKDGRSETQIHGIGSPERQSAEALGSTEQTKIAGTPKETRTQEVDPWANGDLRAVAPIPEADLPYLEELKSMISTMDAPGKNAEGKGKSGKVVRTTSGLPSHLVGTGLLKTDAAIIDKLIAKQPVTKNQYQKIAKAVKDHKEGIGHGENITSIETEFVPGDSLEIGDVFYQGGSYRKVVDASPWENTITVDDGSGSTMTFATTEQVQIDKGSIEKSQAADLGMAPFEEAGGVAEKSAGYGQSPTVFIRAATKKESKSQTEKSKGFESIPEKDGMEKVYKPYGEQGEGYYYVPLAKDPALRYTGKHELSATRREDLPGRQAGTKAGRISEAGGTPTAGEFREEVKNYFVPLVSEYYEKIKSGEQDSEIRPLNHHGWNLKNIYTGRNVTFSKGYGTQDRTVKAITSAIVASDLKEAGIPQWHIDAVEKIYGKQDKWLVAFVGNDTALAKAGFQLTPQESTVRKPAPKQQGLTLGMTGKDLRAPERQNLPLTETPLEKSARESKAREAQPGLFDELKKSESGIQQIGKPKVEVVSEVIGHYESNVTQISGPADVAQMVQEIGRSPQEKFVMVIADGDGRAISILNYSMGSHTASIVHPMAMGRVLQVPGAKQVWFAHNHPSGDTRPSREDQLLTDRLKKVLAKSPVKYAGHIIVGNGDWSNLSADGEFSIVTGKNSAEKVEESRKIPIIERRFKTQDKDRGESIVTIEGFTEFAEKAIPDGGIVLTDAKNRAVVLLTLPEDITRMDGPIFTTLLQEIEKANSSGLLVYSPKREMQSYEVTALKSFSELVGTQLLDVADKNLYVGTGKKYRSWLEKGIISESLETPYSGVSDKVLSDLLLKADPNSRSSFAKVFELGKRVYESGKTKYSEFEFAMHKKMGAAWGKLKGMVRKAWDRLVKINEKLGQRGIVRVDFAKTLNTKLSLPTDDIFKSAVDNTPGSKITEDGLLLNLSRWQKPEQGGAVSVRGGVFYLPEGSASKKHYTTGKNGYGGRETVSGTTLIKNPIFVKGATGGKAPETAFDSLNGKGSYQKMRDEALKSVMGWNMSLRDKEGVVKQFLSKYAPELSDEAYNIIEVSRQGNQLPYALQEAAVASAVRNSGHDVVLGYSKKKDGSYFISEIFDVREKTYPTLDGESEVFDKYTSSDSKNPVITASFPAGPILQAIKAAKDAKAAYPHLVELGQRVMLDGKTKFADFQSGMKTYLGDMWQKFKSRMMDIYFAAKAANKKLGERGSVGEPSGKPTLEQWMKAVEANVAAGKKVPQNVIDDYLKRGGTNKGIIDARGAEIAKTLDLIYNGIQETADGTPDSVVFTDKQTKSTMYVNVGVASVETVKARLGEMRAAFEKVPPPPTKYIPVSTEKAPDSDKKESKLAVRAEADAIKAKLTEDFGDLAEYRTMNMQEQADKAQAIMTTDYEAAKRMAMGEELPPQGVREATMYEAVKIRALKEGDTVTLYNLAVNSTVPTRLSEYGQAIKAADSRLMDDPVKVMQEVIRGREERAKRTGKDPVSAAKIEALTKELNEVTERLRAHEEAASKKQAKTVEHEIKKQVFREAKRASRSASKTVLDEEFSGLSRQLRGILKPGTLNMSIGAIDPSAIPVLVAMAKNRIKSGMLSIEWVVDSIYSEVRKILPDVTKRNVRDAISGYGKQAQMSKEEIDVRLRELKRQARLISALEDAKAGQAPLKSGLTRDEVTDEVRALTKEVKQAMRDSGIDSETTRSPEQQYKSALDAVKTRFRNQIHDINRQLETGQKTPKNKGIEYDAEANALKAERDNLRVMLRDVEGKPEMSPEQRVRVATSAVERSIAELERRIAEHDDSKPNKESKTPETPELKALRDQRERLQEEWEESKKVLKAMREKGKPDEAPEIVQLKKFMADTERRVKAAEKALERSTEEYKRRIAEGDLKPKKQTRSTPETPEMSRIRSLRDGLKVQFKEMQDAAKAPKDPAAIRLKTFKTRTANEIARLEKKLADGDFVKVEKAPPAELDAEGKKLKAAREIAKENYHAAMDASRTVTKEEAAEIVRLSKVTEDARKAMEQGGDRLVYGAARVAYENYVDSLKRTNAPISELLKDRIGEFKTTWKENKPRAAWELQKDAIKTITDNSIAMVASLDNSFLGRQGLKTLMTHPSAWWPGAKNSFLDFAKTIGGKNAEDALHADIYSRPNYVNGEYLKAKIITKTEEQYPDTLPERMPGVGRIFKASEVAFTGSALRMRTDLYDMLSAKAKENGAEMDKKQIEDIGKLINSLTARGKWGDRGDQPIVRIILWAPKMLKGNIDVLTAHNFGAGLETDFARKEAALNLVKIVSITAILMAIANALKPDSAELDPRSSDFGKIKVGTTRFDITGGAASIVVLSSRIVMRASKSTTTGLVTPYGIGYGKRSPFDALIDFVNNKTTPAASVVSSWLKGKNRENEAWTVGDAAYRAFTPISMQNMIKLKDDASADKIAGALVDFIGINSNSYGDSSAQRGDIVDKMRAGKPLNKKQQKAYDAMSKTQQGNVKKESELTPMQAGIKKLPIEDALYAWAEASEKDKNEIRATLIKKIKQSKKSSEEKDAYFAKMGIKNIDEFDDEEEE